MAEQIHQSAEQMMSMCVRQLRLAYLDNLDQGALAFTCIEQACSGQIEFSEFGGIAIHMQTPMSKRNTTNKYDISTWDFRFQEDSGWQGIRTTTSVYQDNALAEARRTLPVNEQLAAIVTNTIYSSQIEIQQIGPAPLTKFERARKFLNKYGAPLASALGSLSMYGWYCHTLSDPMNEH